MGPVPASVVAATFYNFSRTVIEPVLPTAWELASPGRILEARLEVADGALRRVLGDDIVRGTALVEAAGLARLAAASCIPDGRPLFAAQTSLPWP
jgi:hypothetical protein